MCSCTCVAVAPALALPFGRTGFAAAAAAAAASAAASFCSVNRSDILAFTLCLPSQDTDRPCTDNRHHVATVTPIKHNRITQMRNEITKPSLRYSLQVHCSEIIRQHVKGHRW